MLLYRRYIVTLPLHSSSICSIYVCMVLTYKVSSLNHFSNINKEWFKIQINCSNNVIRNADLYCCISDSGRE